MKKLLIFAAMLAAAQGAFAEPPAAPPVTTQAGVVTISSRGIDVRDVIHDLFSQSKKNYVLEPTTRAPLYLSLSAVDFDEALQIVCKLAGFRSEMQNGIFYITRDIPTKVLGDKAIAPSIKAVVTPAKGTVTNEQFARKVTTRFIKTDLRTVVESLAKQAGVLITLDASVPALKLDAFLAGASLKYALDTLTKATGLTYTLTNDRAIIISKPNANRVAVVSG